MVGEAASKHPDIVRMVAKAGHVISNHSWNHKNLTKIRSRRRRLMQMWACARATAPYCKPLFRPPFGMQNSKIRFDALLFRYKIILWSASAQDWISQGSEEIAQKIIDGVKPGSIFLLHDSISVSKVPNTLWDRGVMIDGLEMALDVLKPQMYFVTIPELLRSGRSVCNWPHK